MANDNETTDIHYEMSVMASYTVGDLSHTLRDLAGAYKAARDGADSADNLRIRVATWSRAKKLWKDHCGNNPWEPDVYV